MGRHRAPRRHAPVGVLVAVGVVGSAGIAWAVGADPAPEPQGRVGTTVAPSSGPTPLVTAPTPKPTASSTPVVSVVVPTATPTVAPTTAVPATTTAAPADPPPATSEPEPTRPRPSKGVVPTPKPTKTK